MAIVAKGIVARGIEGVLAAVALATVLTAPSAAAPALDCDYRPAVMRMEYTTGDLNAVVHAPRTLTGTRPLVFSFRGYDYHARSLARQGFIVVLVSDRTAVSRNLQLWRELAGTTGPLVERFRGFAGHLDLSGTVAQP